MLPRPAILFLDEPMIWLDPVARRVVWDRLLDLRRDYGMTVLIATHDMEETAGLSDKLAILHVGRVSVTSCARGSERARPWMTCSCITRAA